MKWRLNFLQTESLPICFGSMQMWDFLLNLYYVFCAQTLMLSQGYIPSNALIGQSIFLMVQLGLMPSYFIVWR